MITMIIITKIIMRMLTRNSRLCEVVVPAPRPVCVKPLSSKSTPGLPRPNHGHIISTNSITTRVNTIIKITTRSLITVA